MDFYMKGESPSPTALNSVLSYYYCYYYYRYYEQQIYPVVSRASRTGYKSYCQYASRATISKCIYKFYDILNKLDFKCFLYTGSVLAEVTFVSRLFQRHGAATPKARSPSIDRGDLRTVSLFDAVDLSRVLRFCLILFCLILKSKTNSNPDSILLTALEPIKWLKESPEVSIKYGCYDAETAGLIAAVFGAKCRSNEWQRHSPYYSYSVFSAPLFG